MRLIISSSLSLYACIRPMSYGASWQLYGVLSLTE